jgi:DNA-binding beta-propeller fold protein YncE
MAALMILSLAACGTTQTTPSAAPASEAPATPAPTPEATPAPTPEAPAEKQYFLCTGRWDNTVIVIDLEKALDPANDSTENAVVNRLRATEDIDPDGDGVMEVASGQPIYITINQDRMEAYVTNHSGSVSERETGSYELGWASTGLSSFGQHGQKANFCVIDLNKALDSSYWNTLGAVKAFVDAHGDGATGSAVSPDGKYLALTIAEHNLSEDGGHWINVFDLDNDYKFVTSFEMASDPVDDEPHFEPDERFGGFPCPNSPCFSTLGGEATVFTTNGGTLDVSVIDWEKLMSGEEGAESARIPTQSGGFGLSCSPDGRFIATTSREDPKDESEGNTISIIDVEKARTDPENAEINRILVGSDDPEQDARPFVAAYSPDGSVIVVSCFRTNNITVVDAKEAEAGGEVHTIHVPLDMPDDRADQPSKPRGVAFSADGRYVAISGAPPKGEPGSGVVWIVDTSDWTVKGRVTGIGNETYMLGGFIGPEVK